MCSSQSNNVLKRHIKLRTTVSCAGTLLMFLFEQVIQWGETCLVFGASEFRFSWAFSYTRNVDTPAQPITPVIDGYFWDVWNCHSNKEVCPKDPTNNCKQNNCMGFVYFGKKINHVWFVGFVSFFFHQAYQLGCTLVIAEGGLHASLPVRGMSALVTVGVADHGFWQLPNPSKLSIVLREPCLFFWWISSSTSMTLETYGTTLYDFHAKSEWSLSPFSWGLRWPLESSIWSWSLGLSWSWSWMQKDIRALYVFHGFSFSAIFIYVHPMKVGWILWNLPESGKTLPVASSSQAPEIPGASPRLSSSTMSPRVAPRNVRDNWERTGPRRNSPLGFLRTVVNFAWFIVGFQPGFNRPFCGAGFLPPNVSSPILSWWSSGTSEGWFPLSGSGDRKHPQTHHFVQRLAERGTASSCETQDISRHLKTSTIGRLYLRCCIDATLQYPYAPCMEYLATFIKKMTPMLVNVPYMEHMG